MRFDSKEQLSNHVSKFCVRSDYGNVKRLQEKLDEANKAADGPKIDLRNNLSVSELKQYLRGEEVPQASKLQEMSLGELRQNIRAVESEFASATRDQIARKEQDVRDELNNLRLERQQIRAKRKQEEAVLDDLMNELDKRKERELKARAEKEQIDMAMRDLESRKLTTLEAEKKKELQKLHDEREALRLKEEELMNEVQRLQQRIDDNERLWKAERDKANLEAQGVDVSINMQNLHKRQLQLAKERGEFAASLAKKKEILENERVRIMDDLRKMKKGDFGSIRKNAAGVMVANRILGNPAVNLEERKLPSQAQKLREKMNEDYDRLDRLKKQHQETLGREERGFELVDRETARSELRATPREPQAVPNFASNNMNFPAQDNRSRFIQDIENLRNAGTPQYVPRVTSPKPAEPSAQPLPMQGYPYGQNSGVPGYGSQNMFMPGGAAPNPYNTAGPMPGPLGPGYPPYGFPSYPQYPPFPMPGSNPYFYPPYPPPVEDDTEAKQLLKKVKKLKKKLNEPQHDQFYSSLQEGLKAINSRINGQAPHEAPQKSQQDLLPEEKALRGVIQQEQNDLRILAALPKGSDLYNAKLEHYKEMTGIRMRMEAMLQELTLGRMKRNFEREMELEDRKYENEKWIEDQKRAILLNRLPEIGQDVRGDSGFTIFWDFVSGIPTKYKQCQLVYGIYEKGEERLEAKLVPKVTLEPDGYKSSTSLALFASEHDVSKLQSNPDLILVIEVQVVVEGRMIQLGWSAVDLFTPQRFLQEGLWKLPIYRPPTDLGVNLGDLRKLSPIPNAYIFGRIAGPASNLRSMAINPDHSHSYSVPQCHVAPSSVQRATRESRDQGSYIVPRSARSGINTLANNGIAVNISKLLGFISKSLLRFRVSLYLDDKLARDKHGKSCQWLSDSINALGLESGSGRSRRIPGTQLRADKAELRGSEIDLNSRQSAGLRSMESGGHNLIQVAKSASFFNNFYTDLHRNDWSQTLFLVIEVLEKTSSSFSNAEVSRDSDPGSYVPVAWAVMQLSDADRRVLNFETAELNLYQPPVIVPVESPEELRPREGTIDITVYEPTEELASRLSGPRPGSLSALKPSGRLGAFLENLTPQIEDARFYEKGDGIDFYVDAARFLPDNTSCTKVLVKAFNSNLEKVGQSFGGLPDLASDAYSPVFGFRCEFRKPIFDPTTTIAVTLLTIDTQHNTERVLGYTAINMFLNKQRNEQPTNPNDQDFIVNKGNFQMRIYCQEPYRKPPFGIGSYKKLEAIPCATLLIRIREAAKADNGLRVLSNKDVPSSEWHIRGIVVKPPKYEDRAYNTSDCIPSNIERKLYELRQLRKPVTVRDATYQVQNQLGIRLDLNDENLTKWIDQRLQVNPRTPMLDVKYFAKYNADLGFKVAVDAVHNTPSDDPHVVIFCLNPPGALYSSTVITEDVLFTTKVEWTSSIKTPQYLDGFHTYKNIMFDKNLHLIIDVRAVSFAKQRPEVLTVGWTILPIFSADGYVRSGIYQMPVFKGPVPASFLPDLASNDPWVTLMNAVNKPGGPVYFNPVSVIVRLVDSQRDGHFTVPLDVNRFNYDYIAEELKAKMAYNAAAQAKAEQQRKLKSLVPANFSPETYLKRVNEAVANVRFS